MDELLEKLFLPIQSTCKKDFLHFNFKGGATRLTMLNSHHWPSMAFTFLVALLTEERMQACAKCFSEEDMEVLDYPWDDTPPMDLAHIYKPPMLVNNNEDLPEIDDDSDEMKRQMATKQMGNLIQMAKQPRHLCFPTAKKKRLLRIRRRRRRRRNGT